MKPIAVKVAEGVFRVDCPLYGLEINGHEVSVLAGGEVLAVLDVRCGVPQTLDDNSGAIEDAEPDVPVLTGAEITADEAVFTWKNKSSLWNKTYVLRCNWLRYTFEVTVEGKGRVDAVQYFSGDAAAKCYGSRYEFSEGFIGATNMRNLHNYAFPACHSYDGYSEELVPPMFCYAFRAEACARRIGFGLVAKRGEHNFHKFNYRTLKKNKPYPYTRFWLETDQAGHTTVDGKWTAPMILGLFGDDPWEILNQYRDYYFASGIARPYANTDIPRFWHGPILCGYIEQLIQQHNLGVHWMKLANEEFYEGILAKAKHHGLEPGFMIIDDKWQVDYANDVADPEKFPNMRAFIDRRHAEGLKTVLWWKLWDAEGAKPEWCTPTCEEDVVRIDPSNPDYLKMLDENLYRLLSSDEGCYDADGLKIDFGFFNPIGRNVKTHSGKYGVELFYDYLEHIYKRAKEVKADCLMNSSPCHPYFADICDEARIHDYYPRNRNNREELELRTRLYTTALPGVLVDTDNAGFNTRRDILRWLLTQQHQGAPALYAVSGTENSQLDDADFRAIAQVWREYNAKIDAQYAAKK